MQTKEYQIMQAEAINAVIKHIWAGRNGYEASMMESSASFQLLFRSDLYQIEDSEQVIRK